MAIVALLASLAIGMSRGTGRGQLKALALETADLLRRQRLSAVLTGSRRQVFIDGGGRTLFGDGRKTVKLPDDVVLDVLGAHGAAASARSCASSPTARRPERRFAFRATASATRSASIGSPAGCRSLTSERQARSGGFTLLEALVALALLLAFAATIVPFLSQARGIMSYADRRVAAHVLLRSLLTAPYSRVGSREHARGRDLGPALAGRCRAGLSRRDAAERGRRLDAGPHHGDGRLGTGAQRHRRDRAAGAPRVSGARRDRLRAASGGFSLLELLAALAIGSVVLAAIAGLIRNVGLSFEAGTRGVGHAERLLLALERIATDLASTRYVHISGEQGAQAIFNGGAKKLAFISGAGVASGTPGEEIVVLEVEDGSDATRLVRRRAPWLGRAAAAEAKPRDAVVLLEGNLQISFLYSDRSLVWVQSWADNADLPHYIRLVLRDRATGAAVLEPPVFEIRSDARPSCSKLGATPYCLGQQPASPASQPRSNPR